jgi:hypothetical protein
VRVWATDRDIGRTHDIVVKQAAALALVSILCAGQTSALETDQYYAWGRPLSDSTEAVNAKFNLELERAVASFPASRPPETCTEISLAFRKRVRFLLMHEIQVWAWNSQWVARIPDGGAEAREYRRANLYSNHPLIDTGTWMPFTPTIDVAGVRMGTDKLAHFVSSGWTYYAAYCNALENGDAPDDAERNAVRRGILEERLILGGMTSGVQAIADLEAGYGGMHFYRDLCDADEPILKLEEGGWTISRPIDLRDYVTPRWDESYQPPVYSKGRWHKVKPVLAGYCDRLDDPQVVAMRRRYRERDTGSLVGEVVAERVEAGVLEDPAQFGIEAVCDEPDPSRIPAPAPSQRIELVNPSVDRAKVMEGVVEEDHDRQRLALGLTGVQLTYPQVVSASIAVMLTSQPSSYDCTTPCDFRGPFAQLEPGLGGGKLSFGWARVTGDTNRHRTFMTAAFIGLAYKLTLFRSWGENGWVEAGRTYAGVELGLPVAQANLGLGVLYRVDGGDRGRWVVTGGAGWGF